MVTGSNKTTADQQCHDYIYILGLQVEVMKWVTCIMEKEIMLFCTLTVRG